MARPCQTCGSDLFLGEQICGSCRTPVEPAPGEATAGPASPGAPRPEGLNLIIGKMQADAESFRDDDRWEVEPAYDDDVEGVIFGRGVEVSNLVRPQRDRNGKVIVDLKYALIGAVVVAIVAGLAYWYLASTVAPGLPGS